MVIKYMDYSLNKGLDLSNSIQDALNDSGVRTNNTFDGSFGYYSFFYMGAVIDVSCERYFKRSNSKAQYITFGSRDFPGRIKTIKFPFDQEISAEKLKKAIDKIVADVGAYVQDQDNRDQISLCRVAILNIFKEKVSYHDSSFVIVIGEKLRDHIILNLETMEWKKSIEVQAAFYSSVRKIATSDDFRFVEKELLSQIREEATRVKKADADLIDKLNVVLKTIEQNEESIKYLIKKVNTLSEKKGE
jgi:hypothetical protein